MTPPDAPTQLSPFKPSVRDEVPAPPPAPKKTDPEVEDERRRQVEAARAAQGRRATVLTSPQGAQKTGQTQRASVLGA